MSFTVTSVAVTLYAALLLIYFLFNMTGKDKATGELRKENACHTYSGAPNVNFRNITVRKTN